MKYLGLWFFEKFVKPFSLPSYILNVRSLIPPLDTSTTDDLPPLHPQAVENASPDPTFTNTDTPMH